MKLDNADGVPSETQCQLLARIPLSIAAGLNTTAATVFTSLNTAVATAVPDLMEAAALPADIVALPAGFASGVSDGRTDTSTTLAAALHTAGERIDVGADGVLSVSADLHAQSLAALGNPVVLEDDTDSDGRGAADE